MKTHQKNTILDKAAGLESHQFVRDEHRFNMVFTTPLDYKNLPRQPRVGQNTRNISDKVFQFTPSTNNTKDIDRFDRTPVVFLEKKRQDDKKEKYLKRVEMKRFIYLIKTMDIGY